MTRGEETSDMPKQATRLRPFVPEESAHAWFGELVLAIGRGDLQRAAMSQRELARLGWDVRQRRPYGNDTGQPGHGEGRRCA
jgi:hypothetical protein